MLNFLRFRDRAAYDADFDGDPDMVTFTLTSPSGATIENTVFWSEGDVDGARWSTFFPPPGAPSTEPGGWTIAVMVTTESGDSNILTCDVQVLDIDS